MPNPSSVPAPENFTALFFGNQRSIVEQYISMAEKTHNYFEYAQATGLLSDYGNAVMRYAAYSTVCIFGINLFFANKKLGVKNLTFEKMNNFLYGRLLFDISDFSWVMLQHTFRQHAMSAMFTEEKIFKFLNRKDTPEFYWRLVFTFLTGVENSEFAFQKLKFYTKQIADLEPEKLDNLPSAQTKAAFNEMLTYRLIGDPNVHSLFDAKFMAETIVKGPWGQLEQNRQIENSELVRILTPEIKFHLLSDF